MRINENHTMTVCGSFATKQKKRRSWWGKGIKIRSGTELSSVIVTYS